MWIFRFCVRRECSHMPCQKRAENKEGKLEKDFYGNPIVPLRLVNNKVIVASDEEVEANPRARSAKLRIAEKI